MGEPSPADVRSRLREWYASGHRDLPWRRTRDPYRILVAEYLLQRTRIAAGLPYYERFLTRFPTVHDLAEASIDDVLSAWEGIGFYGRARRLHAAAQVIVGQHEGKVPASYEALAALPGIGPYTAGAVGSIAFGLAVPAVDGNVTRVIARLFRIREDVKKRETEVRIRDIAARLVPTENPGTFNQAMMELGATVCTPTAPVCPECPLDGICLARAAGEERRLPVSKRARLVVTIPVVFGLVRRPDGRVLLVRRPEGGLLAGLWALPGGERREAEDERGALRRMIRAQTGLRVRVASPIARVSHTFSHRRWSGTIYKCAPAGPIRPGAEITWMRPPSAPSMPLVPFHRKAIADALQAEPRRERP